LLSPIRFPHADEAAISATPRVNHNVYPAVYLTQTPDSGLTVIAPVVDPLQEITVKQREYIREIDLTAAQLRRRLVVHQFEISSTAGRSKRSRYRKPRYVIAHRAQEAVHFGQQLERII
jgi:hypothetical protein